MTVIPPSVSSLPQMVPDRWPGTLSSAEWVPDTLPVWLVAMPTVATDGTCGTQWFAVRTRTAAQATADATVYAGSTQAVMRRRGARICIEQAQVTLWNADGAW